MHTFEKEWFEEKKKDMGNIDRNLFDKVIHAFYLLEKLAETKMEFVFKGGTCLLLLLQDIKRFSIDIDIILENSYSEEKLEKVLEKIVAESLFIRYEKQSRNAKSKIKKAHYKFYYMTDYDDLEKYILLDVIFEKNPYSEIDKKEIKCPFLNVQSPANMVNVPSIENILGDKLTAFAPNTTGIPYHSDKDMEIIKQLFDVDILFDEATNLEDVKATFIKCATQELEYRNMEELNVADVLKDTFQTALVIGARGSKNNAKFKSIENGVTRIKHHIIGRNYLIEDAVVSASKAAYLTVLIFLGETEAEHYDKSIVLPEPKRRQLFKRMNKVITFRPEAYFYFSKAQELLEQQEELWESWCRDET